MSADKRAIRTDQAPTPTGPFNQAIRVGNLVFTAGQAGRNRETGHMGDIREQTDWALRNLAGLRLAEADLPGARGLLERALAIYEQQLGPDDAVLVKASNSVGLAKLVERVAGGLACST